MPATNTAIKGRMRDLGPLTNEKKRSNIAVKRKGVTGPKGRNILKAKKGGNYFGQVLKEIRLQKNLTQGQAALLLSVSQAQWSSYEKGNSRPTLDVIIAIARAFEIEPLALIGKSLDKFNFPTEPNKELSFVEYEKISKDVIEDYRNNRLEQIRLPR